MTGCQVSTEDGAGSNNAIIYTATQYRSDATKDTESIVLAFSENVTGLTKEEIEVSGTSGSVTTGDLSGSAAAWILAVDTVQAAGDITVSITKPGIDSASKTVRVYKGEPIDPPPVNGSTETGSSITKFTIGGADDPVEGDIDQESQTIVITLPSSQTDFTVAVTISDGATVALLEAEKNGVSKYRVTSGNGENYTDYTVYKTWLGGAGLELSGGPFISGETLSVTVSPPENWPHAVSRWVGSGKENHFVLTATPGYDHYRWYVDGEQFFYYDSDAPSPDSNVVDCLTGGNYAAGKHILFLVAIKNGVPYTWEQAFTVIE
ncbi:MAG: hypothetical protein LBD96_02945 [Treponema sp.]|jgi:hypothetical protein|nr:hypothetical protein [Treponema sp.]